MLLETIHRFVRKGELKLNYLKHLSAFIPRAFGEGGRNRDCDPYILMYIVILIYYYLRLLKHGEQPLSHIFLLLFPASAFEVH